MLIVSDAMSLQNKGQASLSDILGTSDVGSGSNDSDMMGYEFSFIFSKHLDQ